jgi:hypothetical protein
VIPLLALLLAATPPQPTSKQVIAAALKLHDLPLESGTHCEGAGTSPDDKTVGDFLAGWLYETFVPGEGLKRRQWIRTRCETDPENRAPWRCDVELFMQSVPRSDEMIGGWGLRFLVDAKKRPLRSWFECLGTG